MLTRAGLAVALGPLAGCAVQRRINRARFQHLVPVEGEPIMLGQLAGLDVDHHFGAVSVIADHNQPQAEVEVRLRRPGGIDPYEYERLREQIWYAAHTEDMRGRRVLRVLVRGVPGHENTLPSHVVVRMPSCDGLAVRTAGGEIRLTNVAGAMQLENGRGALPGGRIICRTERPLLDPVNMLTTKGGIVLACPPASQGQVDLETDNGRAVFDGGHARVRDARPRHKRWSGTINDGTNPVNLRSLDGTVRMVLSDRPLAVPTSSPA